jgi:hypothetical protein
MGTDEALVVGTEVPGFACGCVAPEGCTSKLGTAFVCDGKELLCTGRMACAEWTVCGVELLGNIGTGATLVACAGAGVELDVCTGSTNEVLLGTDDGTVCCGGAPYTVVSGCEVELC